MKGFNILFSFLNIISHKGFHVQLQRRSRYYFQLIKIIFIGLYYGILKVQKHIAITV